MEVNGQGHDHFFIVILAPKIIRISLICINYVENITEKYILKIDNLNANVDSDASIILNYRRPSVR